MNGELNMLPVLRPDLEFVQGPPHSDGSPSYMIHDLLHDTYDKATWSQIQIMKHLLKPVSLERLMEFLHKETTLSFSAEEVVGFCRGLIDKGFTTETNVQDVNTLSHKAMSRKKSLGAKMLHSYLYFRIPLIHPDRLLDKTLSTVSVLGSAPMRLIYILLSLYGLISVVQQLDFYLNTFQYFFNMTGIICYSLSIVIIKIIHELSHAYCAKSLGNRVRTMGVAFIVMWPVAYCDVTDCWRMHSRRKRLLVSFAGIIAEIVIAGLSLAAWSVAPEGIFKSIFFILSSVTIVSTLLVNLNPAMRFDGYYIFSDLIGVDNLQSNAFAYTRSVLYRVFLGIVRPLAEVYSDWQKPLLLCYSLYTWVYRIFLYLGIAVLVYYKFTKFVGIFLFLVEIVFFLGKPISNQIRSIYAMKNEIKLRWAGFAFIILSLSASFWWMGSLKRSLDIPAVTTLQESQTVFAANSGVVSALDATKDSLVKKGQLLFEINSEHLNARLELMRLEIEKLEREIAQLSSSEVRKGDLPMKKEELTRAEYNYKSLVKERELCRIEAPFTGQIIQWDDSIRNGRYIAANSPIGVIGKPESVTVIAYVKEDDIADIAVNATVTFSDQATDQIWNGRVTQISPVRSRYITHKALCSVYGGDIAVVSSREGQLEAVNSYYQLTIALAEPHNLRIGQIGSVSVETQAKSLFVSSLSYAYQTLIRESSF